MPSGRLVNPKRVTLISDGQDRIGPVIYWMSRDQRAEDNWALLHAAEIASSRQVPLGVVFCLVPSFLGATARQYEFMLEGLKHVQKKLARKKIPFFLLAGAPDKEIPRFIKRHGVSILVTDFSPLKINHLWKNDVVEAIDIPLHEVDAHNIVPCRHVSGKQEYGAYTIRPKIYRLLPEFLTEFPPLRTPSVPWSDEPPTIDWDRARKSLKVVSDMSSVPLPAAGQAAAMTCLREFIIHRLSEYHEKSNDPNADTQSGLSPYFHFGHISAQRIAFEIQKHDADIKAQEAFLEQLIVRRELSDNFCLHNRYYDSFDGFPEWAKRTLDDHRRDLRPYTHGREDLEEARTHDSLWNAAQLEMVITGKMHGYLRMYWAKKILEWSASPEDAVAAAIYLNDKYQLDGRDPNGYTGIAWSIGGVHDRPWGERAIFGKIRFMSYEGCRRKFDVAAYIERIGNMTSKRRS
jgi:deoxyribodipyrimidine photo-lyase